MPLVSCAPKLSPGVDERGFLPLRQRAAFMPHPFGLIPPKAPVLGAACGRKTPRDLKPPNIRKVCRKIKS